MLFLISVADNVTSADIQNALMRAEISAEISLGVSNELVSAQQSVDTWESLGAGFVEVEPDHSEGG